MLNRNIEIVYYTDPLCCWSFAMQQQWKSIAQNSAVRYRYCMGGLLPSWDQYNDPVNSVSRPVQMGPVWMQATHLTGVPIKNSLWITDPPSSSYLACMAVKAAGLQGFGKGEQMLFRLQEAVMTNGINIARLNNVVQIAVDAGLDRDEFYTALHDGTALELFRKDLDEISRNRVERFPSFLIRETGHPTRMVSGYQRDLSKLIFITEPA